MGSRIWAEKLATDNILHTKPGALTSTLVTAPMRLVVLIKRVHVHATIERKVGITGRNVAQGHPSEDVQKRLEIVRERVQCTRVLKQIRRHELPCALDQN